MAFSKWINPVVSESANPSVEFMRLPLFFREDKTRQLLDSLTYLYEEGGLNATWEALSERVDLIFSWWTCRFDLDWHNLCAYFESQGEDCDYVLDAHRITQYIEALTTYLKIWEEYGEVAEYQDEDAA